MSDPTPDGDDYPGGWFGESWGAPVCEEAPHRETPIGKPCLDCGIAITEDDQGMLMPHVFAENQWRLAATHLKCFLRSIGAPFEPVADEDDEPAYVQYGTPWDEEMRQETRSATEEP
jgi:hypothetical protein